MDNLKTLKEYIEQVENNAILYDWGASMVIDMILEKIEEFKSDEVEDVKLKPNQFVVLKHLKTGQQRRGYVQSYTPDTIVLIVKLKAPNWKVISEGLKQ
jgi:hypothetical protein